MKIRSILYLAMMMCVVALSAQHKIELRGHAGVNIGGTASFSMPSNVSKINVYAPNFTPFVGADVIWHVDHRWALKSGLTYETKGMRVEAEVKSLFIDLLEDENDGETYAGMLFTGTSSTTMRNQYITLPLMITFKITPRIELDAGAYCSFLIKAKYQGHVYDGYIRENPLAEKMDIEADYDFESKIRKTDYGLKIGATTRVYNNFNLFGHFTYSLPRVTKSNNDVIEMRNIFGSLGVSYTFF